MVSLLVFYFPASLDIQNRYAILEYSIYLAKKVITPCPYTNTNATNVARNLKRLCAFPRLPKTRLAPLAKARIPARKSLRLHPVGIR
jgi:hypothetical protein